MQRCDVVLVDAQDDLCAGQTPTRAFVCARRVGRATRLTSPSMRRNVKAASLYCAEQSTVRRVSFWDAARTLCFKWPAICRKIDQRIAQTGRSTRQARAIDTGGEQPAHRNHFDDVVVDVDAENDATNTPTRSSTLRDRALPGRRKRTSRGLAQCSCERTQRVSGDARRPKAPATRTRRRARSLRETLRAASVARGSR